MKKLAWVFAALMVLLPAAAVVAANDASQTLNGRYVWENRNVEGDLEAVFTQTGEEQWSVDFHFKFRGEPHTYSGVARGSLTDGELSGEVLNENKKRTFVFKGECKDGKFQGTHAELDEGEEFATGTLTLG